MLHQDEQPKDGPHIFAVIGITAAAAAAFAWGIAVDRAVDNMRNSHTEYSDTQKQPRPAPSPQNPGPR